MAYVPPFRGREFPTAYAGGTVVDGMASPTQLPVLHWFVKDPEAAAKDEDTPCSVYFRGEFYDDVYAHRRGAGRRENQQNGFGAVMTKVRCTLDVRSASRDGKRRGTCPATRFTFGNGVQSAGNHGIAIP